MPAAQRAPTAISRPALPSTARARGFLDERIAFRVIGRCYKGNGPHHLVHVLHQHRELCVQGVPQVLVKRVF
jgi:hypothetical protein